MRWSDSVAQLEATRRAGVIAAWSATVTRLVELADEVAVELAAADRTIADLVAEIETLRQRTGLDRVGVNRVAV
jgi:hypothetical protein